MKKFDVLMDGRQSCSLDITKTISSFQKIQGFECLRIVSFSDEFTKEKKVQTYRDLKGAISKLHQGGQIFVCQQDHKANSNSPWPSVDVGVDGMWVRWSDLGESARTNSLANLRSLVDKKEMTSRSARKKILYVAHTDIKNVVGGVQFHVASLVKVTSKLYDVYVLYKVGNLLVVENYFPGRERKYEFGIQPTLSSVSEFNSEPIEDTFKFICDKFKFNIIHFHHIIGLPWSLFKVAKQKSKNVFFTIHDYYTYCQRYDLIDSKGEYCGFSKSEKNCNACRSAAPALEADGFKANKESFAARRSKVKKLLTEVNLIAPSQNVYDNLVSKMKISAKQIEVIEHPILKNSLETDVIWNKKDKIAMAFVGNFSVKKGAEVFLKIVSEWDQKKIPVRWHVFGKVTDVVLADELMQKYDVKFHGHYDVQDLPNLFKKNRIHIGLLLSIWPETFSYALNDILKAGGVPICTDIGAPADRIREGGFGWTISLEKPTENLQKIISNVLAKPALLKQKRLKKPKEEYAKQIVKLLKQYSV